MNTATMLVSDVLEYEKKRLRTECMEKCLYHGSGSASPMALFGSGAEIKHLELEKHSLSVDVYHSNINAIDDKELLMFFEKNTSGSICAVYKFQGRGKDPPDREKWGKITFLSLDAAKRAVELDGDEFCGSNLKILPSQSAMGGDKTFLFPEVKARIFWPRRLSRGFGIVISATWNKVSNPKTQLSKAHHANSLIQSLPYFIHHRRRRPPPLPPKFNSDNQSPRRKLPRHQFPITKPLSRIPSVDPLKQHFLVGSLCHRTISSTSDDGITETLISDTSLPENVIIVGITVDSRNNCVLAVIHAVKPLPPFNALAAYGLKSGNRLFLSPLPTDE
ncbi:hypothetical protein KIW84_050832 [Lathyrus oleraceus]|uniref:DEAH11/12 RNA-binding domain-containing protein n=1 Tax=Pisum sativum TaxID=3888 RepID=A0A9D4WMC6_PEA|nr:hypothetical protein KIW84_050832 [Pisum sativum]